MRLSSRAHGFFDVVFAIALAVVGFVVGGGLASPAGWVPIAVAVGVLLNLALTDYELGLAKSFDIGIHLWIDGVLGLLLALSPWLLSFDQTAWLPHVVAGIVLIAVALVTNTVPGYDRRAARTATE